MHALQEQDNVKERSKNEASSLQNLLQTLYLSPRAGPSCSVQAAVAMSLALYYVPNPMARGHGDSAVASHLRHRAPQPMTGDGHLHGCHQRFHSLATRAT